MPDKDRFPDPSGSLPITAPPDRGYDIDVSAADVDLTTNARGISTSIWVGVGGNLDVTLKSGARLVYQNIPDGYLWVGRARTVHTGTTTASGLIVHP